MKSGRGGSRYDEDGNLKTGRKKTGKNPRVTFTTDEQIKEWVYSRPDEKHSDYINRLIREDMLSGT